MDVDNGKHEPARETKKQAHKIWLGAYLLISAGLLLLFLLLQFKGSQLPLSNLRMIKRALLCGCFIFAILGVSRYVELLVSRFGHSKAVKYNLVRLTRILAMLAILMSVVAFLFENWYTAAVSLGLFSLILGFALQTPISSFIGWLYIIIRNPYKVGDRIQISDFKGDVVEIGYLDTTLWEFGGDYLTNDLPSGRLIRFPNTQVLQSEVYNYSWRRFPYIWNEIPFHIAYESDFLYVEEVLKRVTKDILGPGMDEKVKELKMLVKQTPVDELTIREEPFVTLRTNSNTWIEVSINYLVDPKHAAKTRSDIIRIAVKELLKEPQKVMFPNSNSR